MKNGKALKIELKPAPTVPSWRLRRVDL